MENLFNMIEKDTNILEQENKRFHIFPSDVILGKNKYELKNLINSFKEENNHLELFTNAVVKSPVHHFKEISYDGTDLEYHTNHVYQHIVLIDGKIAGMTFTKERHGLLCFYLGIKKEFVCEHLEQVIDLMQYVEYRLKEYSLSNGKIVRNETYENFRIKYKLDEEDKIKESIKRQKKKELKKIY